MSVATQLHIGMSLAPTWLSGDAWRRADSNVEGMFDSAFYVDVAQRSEAAHLDFVFRPDSLFLDTRMLDSGPGFASLDPTMLMASLARETRKIGLLSTISTTFYPPYIAARQILSLHHLSKGRAGWNIVTALDGNANFGLDEMPSADDRYARAAEFTDVVKSLWDSFPAEALRIDRESGRYAQSDMVRQIDHTGQYFTVKGPLNLPNYAKARVPLIQAGASPVGRHFASSIADAIFASTPDRDAAIDLRRDLRERATKHGRSPDAIKVLPGLSLYLASSRAEARDLFTETHARTDKARKIATIREMTGLDLTDWPNDRPITANDLLPPPETPRSRTHMLLLRRMIERDSPTMDELMRRPEVVGSAHWQIIGTVDDAVASIRDWTEAGAIDGFVAVPGGSTASLHLTLEGVIPRLAEAGIFRNSYRGDTFADHLGISAHER